MGENSSKPMDYILPQKGTAIWFTSIIFSAIAIASFYIFAPNLAPTWNEDAYANIFPKIFKDYVELKAYSADFAFLFANFSVTLMIITVSTTGLFTIWQGWKILRRGVSIDKSGTRYSVGVGYHLFSIFLASIPIYFVFFPTKFAQGASSTWVDIPMSEAGLIKWGIFFAMGVGITPYVILDYFNSILKYFGYPEEAYSSE